jgi:hypothetical protein
MENQMRHISILVFSLSFTFSVFGQTVAGIGFTNKAEAGN